MKHVGSASTNRKPVAHLLSCVPCATAHPRARARAPGRAKTKASGQKGSKNVKRTEEAYGTGANLLASRRLISASSPCHI
eukprot:scaffold48078_cov27-Phaeocystis_antarctica.AAC.1